MGMVGIERVYLGVLDANGTPITDESKGFTTGMIEVTDEMLGTSTFNFQTSKNSEEIDGNNKQLSIQKAMPTASADITFNSLPFDIQQKVLGREKVGQGWVDSMVNTYTVVIAQSPIPDSNDKVYTVMGKCVATSKGYNLQTSTSKKTNRVSDDLNFEGLACDALNDMPYMTCSSADSGFSKKAMFDQVCPGQTLIAADTVKTATTSTASK